MELTKELNGSTLIVKPAGQIDTMTSPELERFVFEQIDSVGDIVLDLNATNYVSSAGLRVVLAIRKKQTEKQKNLKLVNVEKDIMQVFELTGFSSFLEIEVKE